ncbi:hypothetical protein AVEN_113439-1 [Araneus ventricosus]|uniref:Uncharacterized protein n=1 Tax=Araneus ventricosus TaxID=182803 RepID=A0A4Y2LZ45_ARAVE|nr:hypothetical protein AVEN_113439-1 [Araneus ventricosus]
MHNRDIGPFFFTVKPTTAKVYLSVLELFIAPQLQFQPHVRPHQQDGTPQWCTVVREFLGDKVPDRWIGRDGSIQWPPRSPDITPLYFFSFGVT